VNARSRAVHALRFQSSKAKIEWEPKESKIKLSAEDATKVKGFRRSRWQAGAARVDLRNIEKRIRDLPAWPRSAGAGRQAGLDGDKAKEIIKAIKAADFKVQNALQERQVRVTGKKRDDLQAVIQFLRAKDFGVGLSFTNFRE